MEIWQRICDTGSVLYAIDFHSDEALKQSKKELCDLDKADLEHMYQAFRAQFSIQRFFIQVGRLYKMEIHVHLCKFFVVLHVYHVCILFIIASAVIFCFSDV